MFSPPPLLSPSSYRPCRGRGSIPNENIRFRIDDCASGALLHTPSPSTPSEVTLVPHPSGIPVVDVLHSTPSLANPTLHLLFSLGLYAPRSALRFAPRLGGRRVPLPVVSRTMPALRTIADTVIRCASRSDSIAASLRHLIAAFRFLGSSRAPRVALAGGSSAYSARSVTPCFRHCCAARGYPVFLHVADAEHS